MQRQLKNDNSFANLLTLTFQKRNFAVSARTNDAYWNWVKFRKARLLHSSKFIIISNWSCYCPAIFWYDFIKSSLFNCISQEIFVLAIVTFQHFLSAWLHPFLNGVLFQVLWSILFATSACQSHLPDFSFCHRKWMGNTFLENNMLNLLQ